MTESNRSRRDLIQTAAGLTVATPLAGCNVDVRRTEAEDTPAPTPEERTDTPTDTPEPTPEEETDTPEPSEENELIYIGDIPDTAGWAWPDNYPLRTIHERKKENVATGIEYINDTRDRLDPDDYNPNNESSLEDLMQDAIDISGETYPREEKGKDRSGYTGVLAHMIGDFAKQNYVKDYEAIGTGGDAHGWANLWMEGIPPKIIDINAGVGDIGENHLEGLPGWDKIGRTLKGPDYVENKSGAGKGGLLNLYTYSGFQGDGTGTWINEDVVKESYEQLVDDPEQVFTKVRPALAALWGEYRDNREMYDGDVFILDSTPEELPEWNPGLETSEFSTQGMSDQRVAEVNEEFSQYLEEIRQGDHFIVTDLQGAEDY